MKRIAAFLAVVALTASANPIPWSPVFKPNGDHYIVSAADKEAFDRWVQGYLAFTGDVKTEIEIRDAMIDSLKRELIRRGGKCQVQV